MSVTPNSYNVLCRAIVGDKVRDYGLVDLICIEGVEFRYQELLDERLRAVVLTERQENILRLFCGFKDGVPHTWKEIGEILYTSRSSIHSQYYDIIGKFLPKRIEFKENGETQWLPLREFLQKFFVPKDAPS